MRALWRLGEASNMELVSAITRPKLARNTVMSMLSVLERKGYVQHRSEGRTFIYTAKVAESAVKTNVLKSVMQRFFDDSAVQLVAKLLDAEHVSDSDRDRIGRLVEGARRK
jgi:BlaI family transcriptional regulator, penicillinase repressor